MADELKMFSALLDVPKRERLRHELRLLEALMANAIKGGKWNEALKIFETAHGLLQRAP